MAVNFPGVGKSVSPDGTELGAIVRNLPRKTCFTETTKPLPANGVFVGPWHDTSIDGACFVHATSLSNQASAAAGFVLQATDDPTLGAASIRNLNIAISTAGSSTIAANTLALVSFSVMQRYWRVQYTNGAAAQATFALYSTAVSQQQFPGGLLTGGGNNANSSIGAMTVVVPGSFGTFGDNTAANTNSVSISNMASGGGPLQVASQGYAYGGNFSGAADATRQGWLRWRTPTVFKTVQATATGNTAVWTPGSGNKFRLLKYQVDATANIAISGGGVVLTVSFQDATSDISLTHDIWVPTTTVTTVPGDAYVSGWQDLGQFGVLSASANNVLNVNLSATLTSGNIRVRVCGTEE